MMEELVSKGCSILLVSSDIEELLGMCDRILVIADGRIVLNHSAEGLTKYHLLQASNQTSADPLPGPALETRHTG